METNVVRITVSSGPATGEQREVLVDKNGKEYVNMGITTPRKTAIAKLSDSAVKEIKENKIRLEKKDFSSFAVKLGKLMHKIENLLHDHAHTMDDISTVSDEVKEPDAEAVSDDDSDEEAPAGLFPDDDDAIELFPGCFATCPEEGQDQELIFCDK